MSRSSFSKKEREKKKRKRKKEKEEKKDQRESRDGNNLDEMIMYVDEYGNFTEEPQDPSDRDKVKKEDIIIGIPPKEDNDPTDSTHRGTVKFFNEEKGYGFIVDHTTNEDIFVHATGLTDQIRDNDKVVFEVEMGHKGPSAVDVKLA